MEETRVTVTLGTSIHSFLDKISIRPWYPYNGLLPTDEMLAEFFKNPPQGSFFEILRQFIMGWYHKSLLKTESMS